jgi:hypothetical protein
LGNLLEGPQEVVWTANQVDWAHCQVSGSSGGPDPLVGDGREPSRRGSRGTYVSHGDKLKIKEVGANYSSLEQLQEPL